MRAGKKIGQLRIVGATDLRDRVAQRSGVEQGKDIRAFPTALADDRQARRLVPQPRDQLLP